MKKLGAAVILAGGKSSRMGFDKQTLRYREQRLIPLLAARLRVRFDEIIISSNTPELYQGESLRVVEDIYPDMGPMSGIYSALKLSGAPSLFVMACDMPRIDYPYIDYMLSRLQGRTCDACVTAAPGTSGYHFQAFHSFFFSSALPRMEQNLQAGLVSLNRFFREIDTLVISEAEAAKYTTVANLFMNINTHQDYQHFLDEENEAVF